MKAHATGLLGEEAAAAHLEALGWTILHRRFRVRGGEIDLVAERDGCIIFSEVKTRAAGALDDGRGAVTWHKQRRVARAAAVYVARYHLGDRPCRFDVLTVEVGVRGSMRVTHLEGAFDMP